MNLRMPTSTESEYMSSMQCCGTCILSDILTEVMKYRHRPGWPDAWSPASHSLPRDRMNHDKTGFADCLNDPESQYPHPAPGQQNYTQVGVKL